MKISKKLCSLALSAAMLCVTGLPTFATSGNQTVTIDLWNAHSDQPSMGNIATDNNETALYNPTENTLQIATNPVDVSGYKSGIVDAQYDTGDGKFESVTVLSTGTVETGTKNDGINHTVQFLSSFEIEVPDYLTKEGIEYIPFKMSVPHTPMDVVVGTGFLDARLRLNWDEMTATELQVIVPNTEISTGEVEKLTLEQNGIEVIADTTILPENAELSVTEITSGADFDLAKSALEARDFDLYRVSITASGEVVTPTGSLEIVFPYSNLPELYRINDNGTKTVLRGTSSVEGYSILSRSLGLFAVVNGEKIETTPTEPTASTFTDIGGHWAEENINKAVANGLFNGTSETTFSPEDKMTSGMVITVLYRMAGEPEVTATGTEWYAKAMAWGLEQDIIGGYLDFNPMRNVSREELATMLYRYEDMQGTPVQGADLSKFTDSASISDWAADGLAWANAEGIVTGTSDTTISPKDEASRAVVATMLVRYLGV